MAQLPFDLVNMHLYTVKDAVARGAVCNDGSPAGYYFRDCPRPATECKGWSADWVVLFADGDVADACYDSASCAARQRRSPEKMSSTQLNATLLSPPGIFSYSGEENPNFYGYRTVLVPYCSSDMWLGNATSSHGVALDGRSNASSTHAVTFGGRSIAAAVLQDLASTTFNPTPVPTTFGPGPSQTRLSEADSITLVGGTGIVSLLTGTDGGALASLIPSKPRSRLKIICDGCAIANVDPLVSVKSRPCDEELADCPPSAVLQRGLALWTESAFARPQPPSAEWRSLLADRLLPAVRLPMLVQAQIYDQSQLRQNRAWPPSSAGVAAYIEGFGRTMRSTLHNRPSGGRFTFGVACSPPRPDLLRDANGFFCRPVPCVTHPEPSTNSTAQLRLAATVSMFLRDPGFAPSCVDDCAKLDCNSWCAEPSCWGASQAGG